MNKQSPWLNTKLSICINALAACAILPGAVQAKDQDVTVSAQVSTAGLDLSQPAAARELYGRLHKAAFNVCGTGNRLDLKPLGPIEFEGCVQKALGDSVRSANRPQLTKVYLNTHSLQDAATRGIDVSALMAAK
jgi:UrcA family protein